VSHGGVGAGGGSGEDVERSGTTTSVGFFGVEEEEDEEGDDGEGDVCKEGGEFVQHLTRREKEERAAGVELTDVEVYSELIGKVASHVGVGRSCRIGRVGRNEREDLEARSRDSHRHRERLDGDLSNRVGMGVVAVIVIISTEKVNEAEPGAR